jgi:hypothetical protein
VAGRIVSFLLGMALVVIALASAVQTTVLPRSHPRTLNRLPRTVFLTVRTALRLLTPRSASFERRDVVLGYYAPVALLALLATWIALVLVGYTAMLWALDGRRLRAAVDLSGSSALTLGFDHPRDLPSLVLSFTEAGVALLLLALLIGYLPAIYGAFSRREATVASLETRAGSPPSALAFIERLAWIRGLDDLTALWERWEWWFTELQETHTSFVATSFFRSPNSQHSWVTAAGAVLDAAAIVVSAVDHPTDPAAQLCLRAGWLSLRRVATAFRIPFEADPSPDDPISVDRSELEAVLDHLETRGVALKADRDQVWRDFAGWRVNYDTVLLDLATLVVAPLAPWSSDRAGPWRPWWVGPLPRDSMPRQAMREL